MIAVLVALLLIATPCWAFDMGFDFRGSSGYVTDPAYGVPVLGEAYPHTYTNANGDSLNAGWGSGVTSLDRVSSNDPRIAGSNLAFSVPATFTADLGSGSAPGAGNYTTDIACGDPGNGPDTVGFILKDSSTTLIDGSNGGSGTSVAVNHFLDATVTDVTATTSWTGTTVNVTFATTTATLTIIASAVSPMAHFRLTKSPAAATGPPQRTMTGVGL